MSDFPNKWPDDAPEWANYLTQDFYGELFFFQNIPRVDKTNKLWTDSSGNGKCQKYGAIKNWEFNLLERPKPIKINWRQMNPEIAAQLLPHLFRGEPPRYLVIKVPTNSLKNDVSVTNLMPDHLVVSGMYSTGHLFVAIPSQLITWDKVKEFSILEVEPGYCI